MRICVALLLFFPLALQAADEVQEEPKRIIIPASQIWKTRPQRIDEPLREENISDIEVAQIESVMKVLLPGAIVYISAVTDGCSCHDGAACDSQVWSVANRGDSSREIALSRIEGQWQVGPLQQWWLTYDRLWASYRESRPEEEDARRVSYRELQERLRLHYEAFPFCSE